MNIIQNLRVNVLVRFYLKEVYVVVFLKRLKVSWLNVKDFVVHSKSLQQQLTDPLIGDLHTWNIVSIENTFYHLDITMSKFGVERFDYFNLSDEEINCDHMALTIMFRFVILLIIIITIIIY